MTAATVTVARKVLSILPGGTSSARYSAEQLEEALQDVTDGDDLIPAVVLEASPKLVRAYCKGGEIAEITGDALLFVQQALSKKVALEPAHQCRFADTIAKG